MKYARNYLSLVIFQLKFDPILALGNKEPEEFAKAIKGAFPRVKESQEIELETVMSLNGASKTDLTTRRKRWTFLTEDESKMVTIAQPYFTIEYKKYESLDVAEKDFEFLWGAFQQSYEVKELNRVGLRAINEIRVPTGDPLSWDELIDNRIVAATLGVASLAKHKLSRSMHVLHWLGEDHRLAFQFGINNSDFPNPVAKREFVLDYDCYSIGPTPPSDAVKCLRLYNKLIHEKFESSIAEGLRMDMGIVEDTRSTDERKAPHDDKQAK